MALLLLIFRVAREALEARVAIYIETVVRRRQEERGGGCVQKIRAFALFGVVVVVLVIVAIANVNSSEAQNATAQTGSTSVPSVNSGPASQTESLPSPSVASGVAAIVPRASTDSALTISGAKFTSADATQYVSSHRVPHAQSSANPVVDAAVFITSQEAS